MYLYIPCHALGPCERHLIWAIACQCICPLGFQSSYTETVAFGPSSSCQLFDFMATCDPRHMDTQIQCLHRAKWHFGSGDWRVKKETVCSLSGWGVGEIGQPVSGWGLHFVTCDLQFTLRSLWLEIKHKHTHTHVRVCMTKKNKKEISGEKIPVWRERPE